MTRKPTLTEIIPIAAAYPHRAAAWGNLHTVLDDTNVDDKSVRHAMRTACSYQDAEGVTLALLLLCMSKTQRRLLPLCVSAD